MYIDQMDMCIAVSKALRDQSFCQEEKHVRVCDNLLLVLFMLSLAAHVCY